MKLNDRNECDCEEGYSKNKNGRCGVEDFTFDVSEFSYRDEEMNPCIDLLFSNKLSANITLEQLA